MKFPFTNYQEINLDWILEIVKKFQLLIPSMQEAESNVQAAIDAATEATGKAETAITTATVAVTTSEEAKNSAELANRTAQAAGNTALAAEATARAANATAEEAKTIAGEAMEIAQTAYDKAPIIINSATGVIASFLDGADGMPIRSLIANIEPVQDLHGFSNPWPAGGGTNKTRYPYVLSGTRTINGITFTINSDGTITANGTATALAQIDLYGTLQTDLLQLENGKTYTVSGTDVDGTAINYYVYKNGSPFKEVIGRYNSSDIYSVPDDGNTYACRLVIRVISGSTVTNAVLKPMLAEGSTALPFAPYSNICPISGRTGMRVYREAEYAAEAEPTLYITWETEAGTVYGGTLDVTNGVLTVDRAIYIITGNERTGVLSEGKHAYSFAVPFTFTPPGYNEVPSWICSEFNVVSRRAMVDGGTVGLALAAGNTACFIVPGVTTQADFAVWFQNKYNSEDPVQLVRPLANPVTYQLTPQQLDTLLGMNNIWTDVGTVDVEYPADTKLYIDNKIASTRNEG